MRTNENYFPHIATAAILTLAIVLAFQLFILREPVRIAADETYHKGVAVAAGQTTFQKNCAACHGETGQGSDDGPSLNNKQFLSMVDDGTIFSIVGSGVPNTQMPAWSQSHGGPFTDEDIRNLVAFVRAWQPNAPELVATVKPGDPARGLLIFSSTCYACHGIDGKGTVRAPGINDYDKLHQFDNAWYKDTIMKGRAAQGMPTWGTVLSPAQVNDLIALIDQWRSETSAGSAKPTPTLLAATPAVTPTEVTTSSVDIARPSNPGEGGAALKLKGDVAAGMKVYSASCSKCHGEGGIGGVSNRPGTDRPHEA